MSRVEAVIQQVMKRFHGQGPASQARYFEAVHQELAPLARQLEMELGVAVVSQADANATIADLASLVRRLSRALKQAEPDHDLLATSAEYLKRQGLPTSVLREEA